MQPYHLHPLAVHFPIALLSAGLVAQIAGRGGRAAPTTAAAWLLWCGTAMLWVTLALGVLAERTAPHVPRAWETLHEHRTFGFWTAGLFTTLSLGRFVLGKKLSKVQLVLWLIALAMLGLTGYHGGVLVFTHGVGVAGR